MDELTKSKGLVGDREQKGVEFTVSTVSTIKILI